METVFLSLHLPKAFSFHRRAFRGHRRENLGFSRVQPALAAPKDSGFYLALGFSFLVDVAGLEFAM